jgi:hypothetical protein
MGLRSFLAFIVVLIVGGCVTVARSQRIDYSQFSHRSHVEGLKQEQCESCHRFPSKNWKEVRPGDDAFPDITEYPEHGDCLSCHRAQFFARERPAPRICKNCHVSATPRDSARLPFPSLGAQFLATTKAKNFISDFVINFREEKHADQEVKFQKGGAMHAECFVCHNQESELAPLPQSCGSCHKLAGVESAK